MDPCVPSPEQETGNGLRLAHMQGAVRSAELKSIGSTSPDGAFAARFMTALSHGHPCLVDLPHGELNLESYRLRAICAVGSDVPRHPVYLAGEQASEGDAEAFLCQRRIPRACSSN